MTSEPVTRIKPKTPVPYDLTAIHLDTHDTKTCCFALPDDATLDMLPGDYLYVHATNDGKTVKRPYTPSSMPGATGYFDLTSSGMKPARCRSISMNGSPVTPC